MRWDWKQFVVCGLAMVLALCLCGPDSVTGMAADAATAVAATAAQATAQPEVVAASTFSVMAWLDTIVKAVGSALGLALLWLVKKIFADYSQRQIYTQALAALEEGWAIAQEDFVIWAKRAKADGKLSQDEREEARKLAYEHALKIATGPARELLQAWTQDKILALLSKITTASKTTTVTLPATPASSSGPELDSSANPA